MEKREFNIETTQFGSEITNEELIKLLSQHPLDAKVTIECCNPKLMKYNEGDNTIRID